jgi:hypothetical protein
MFEFESGTFSWFYPIIFLMENRVCLSYGVQVAGAAWRAVTRIMTEVGDMMRRIRDCQAQVGYLVAGRSKCRVTLCAVCTTHEETRNIGFLVEPQNQCGWFVSDLTSKLLR